MMEKEEWRFFYEALVHISSLRLLLTRDSLIECRKLKASLSFSSCLELVCEWETHTGEECRVRVPLPLCPVDHSAAVQAVAREDHIEVKLKLLDGGFGLESSFADLSDASKLSSYQETIFRCRKCGTNITQAGFTCVIELPSVDWRDATDDWFGVCCCSSSIRTESMVAEFEKNIFPLKGKLLVGSSTCILHFEDVREGVTGLPSEDAQALMKRELQHVVEANLPAEPGDYCADTDCGAPRQERVNFSTPGFYEFLKGPVRPASSGRWETVRCCKCSSTLGATLRNEEDQGERALHLFKRHIVADEDSELKEQTFRSYSLQKDFTRELLSRVEQNSAYRFIVRDLNLEKPMLRIVIVNENSFVDFGVVGSRDVSSLIPAVKLMFSDCSEAEGTDMQLVEDWCIRYNVDEIFMFEEEISLLLDRIRRNEQFLPSSYVVSQGFNLSFLASEYA